MPLELLFEYDKPIPQRKEHIYVKAPEDPEELIPKCNTKTIPGCLTERGCAFAGSKGVIMGAVKDGLHVVHAPVGCVRYACGTKRYPATIKCPNGKVLPIENYHLKYIVGTDMNEPDVVYGAEKRLYTAIMEALKEFPFVGSVYIYETCSAGLIGDNTDAIAKKVTKETGLPAVVFHAPGFSGVTQSKGHHVANHTVFDKIVGTKEPPYTTPYDVNLIGEYNIDGDLWIIKSYLNEMGIRVLATFTGDSTHDELAWMHRAKLNLVRCQRSATYIARLMEEKYGIPFLRVDLFGLKYCAEDLRKIGEYFGFEDKAEEVIEKRLEKVKPKIEFYKEKLRGKKVWLFSGGPKNWHLPEPLEEELGMKVIVVSTMFEHEDGYEKIKKRVKPGIVVIDDPNSLEAEEIFEKYKPDIVISGIKEKYFAHKFGIPAIMIHSYENGPYIGFEGFVNLARDIYAAIYNPAWKLMKWDDKDDLECPSEEE